VVQHAAHDPPRDHGRRRSRTERDAAARRRKRQLQHPAGIPLDTVRNTLAKLAADPDITISVVGDPIAVGNAFFQPASAALW
jgi:hypothetical protein